MLTGHSQGGIAAASIASDPDLVKELNIKSVLTAGAPVGRFDIDSSVSALSVENEQDVVPTLDGQENPDKPNWTTVKHRLAGNAGDAPIVYAHDMNNYINTGKLVDSSSGASISDWRNKSSDFVSTNGDATASIYRIVRQ